MAKRNKTLDAHVDTTTRELMVQVLNEFSANKQADKLAELHTDMAVMKSTMKSIDSKLDKSIAGSEKRDADQYDKINANTKGIAVVKDKIDTCQKNHTGMSKLKLSGIVALASGIITGIVELIKFLHKGGGQ